MRLIDADAAYERAQADSRRGALEDWEFDMIVNLLDSAPTVDAVPVTSGERVDVGGFYFRCSECDRLLPFDGNYCPYCGVSLKVGGSDGR